MNNPNESNPVDESTMEELEEAAEELHKIAKEFGLDPTPVNYWLVDYDEINQLAAYDGFQRRYPHWRWGMKYVRRKKQDTYFGGKIFELVNHDTPPNAFLQESNTLQEQKSVIAHVEAHSDFFANNQFFQDEPDASGMLDRHASLIESYYEDPSINHEDVESWIDAILCIENTIDYLRGIEDIDEEEDLGPSMQDKIDSLDVSDEVKKQVFDDMGDEEEDDVETPTDSDVLAFLLKHGKQYDGESGRAVEYEDWQRAILEMLRREAYYFSAQKVTKFMNEGWAALWESMIMTSHNYAEPDEIIDYSDKQARVLNSPGLNPYKIGKELWEYIENRENRKEVVSHILRVDGINWRNFKDEVNVNEVIRLLRENQDEDIIHEKYYSLLRRQNLGFIDSISRDELQRISMYMFDDEKYDTIEEAIDNVDFEAGWKRMREIRETHNDVTFIDSFLTDEFIDEEQYFAYEFNENSNQFEVSDTSLDGVKKKLLLQIANGGKPRIIAADNNFNNAGELLLKHQYNGVALDIAQAQEVLKRMFELWGRPVNLKTIDKNLDGNEQGLMIRYNGKRIEEQELRDSQVEDIKADKIDYDTKPESWL